MVNWKEVVGPWRFNLQKNKWGYLNNPRFMNPSGIPVTYDGNENTEPQIWIPPDNSVIQSKGSSVSHIPCGHWHKGRSDWYHPERTSASYIERLFWTDFRFKFMCIDQTKPFLPTWMNDLASVITIPISEFVYFDPSEDHPLEASIFPYESFIELTPSEVAILNTTEYWARIYWTWYRDTYWENWDDDNYLFDMRYSPSYHPPMTRARIYYKAFKSDLYVKDWFVYIYAEYQF
jgi:hypothetical protein